MHAHRGASVTPNPETRPHRVLVFTTPTCPWCQRAKAYLRSRQVTFTEVDVARDPRAARDLVRRTGQMGVPVIEIDGRPIVGFDQARIDGMLGLAGARAQVAG
jgi:glutaredoxin 3